MTLERNASHSHGDPRSRRRSRPSLAHLVVLPVLVAGLALAGCASEDGATADAAESAEIAAADAAQEAPACTFTAEGTELTNRLSPPDSAAATLDGGVAKICYGAPSVRDRIIMGELVPFDQPWRMGANEPTTLHLTAAAEVGDVRLDPGSYSLFAVPGESEWTIVVNAATERWGVPIDEEVRAEDIGTFTVEPESTDAPVERLSITMEPTGEDAAEVVVEWEETRVSFPIRRAEG